MAEPWTAIPAGPHDIRLVVCDMDGTLLTSVGAVPESFWQLLREMSRRGITFVPASGRQHATLVELFEDGRNDGMSFVAENGSLVTHRGEVVSRTTLDDDAVDSVIDIVRTATDTESTNASTTGPGSSADLGLVVCGVRSAYIERSDADFVAEARKYYAKLEIVDDVRAVSDDVLKLAVFDFADAEHTAQTLFGSVGKTNQVVVSGRHWFDIMSPGIDKGIGVRALQETLGVDAASTAVFGDYLNDLEMLGTGEWSFAMANAHPDIKTAARFVAPANTDDGVVTVLQHLLGV